jgi:hypothetical protein
VLNGRPRAPGALDTEMTVHFGSTSERRERRKAEAEVPITPEISSEFRLKLASDLSSESKSNFATCSSLEPRFQTNFFYVSNAHCYSRRKVQFEFQEDF